MRIDPSRYVDRSLPKQLLGELQVPGLRIDEAGRGMPKRMETGLPRLPWDAQSV